VAKRPIPPPLSKTERTQLDDLIRRGANAINPAEGNRLLRLLELDHADRQQERRTAGGLMAQMQQIGGQLKDMTTRAEEAEAKLAAVRALHHDDYGLCHACTNSHGIPWPCLTITAIDATTVKPESVLAAVRAFADQLIAAGSAWDGNEPSVGEDLLEILDGPTDGPSTTT